MLLLTDKQLERKRCVVCRKLSDYGDTVFLKNGTGIRCPECSADYLLKGMAQGYKVTLDFIFENGEKGFMPVMRDFFGVVSFPIVKYKSIRPKRKARRMGHRPRTVITFIGYAGKKWRAERYDDSTDRRFVCWEIGKA